MKNLLSSEICKLESLNLDDNRIENAASLDHITGGLAHNNSVKCLRIDFGFHEPGCTLFLSSMVKLLKSATSNVTEKLQLVYSYLGLIGCANLAKLVKKMPRLRSLNIKETYLASLDTDSEEAKDAGLDTKRMSSCNCLQHWKS